jgi:hypothetical protein
VTCEKRSKFLRRELWRAPVFARPARDKRSPHRRPAAWRSPSRFVPSLASCTAGRASEPFLSARLSSAKRHERRFPPKFGLDIIRSQQRSARRGARRNHRGTTVSSPVEKEPSLAASALRMRRHRERRRRGVLCFRVELTENVINELVRRKRLTAYYRENPNAVGQALQRYLEYTMW